MHRDRDIDSDPLDGRTGCSVGTKHAENENKNKNEIENQRAENIKTDVIRTRTEIIANVDYMLQAVGLPTYSLLQRSCEEATKFVLSITKEPRITSRYEVICRICNSEHLLSQKYDHSFTARTGCSHAMNEKDPNILYAEMNGIVSPSHTVNQITALTLLRPQPNENISQWAVRYVEAMLAD